MKTKIKAVVVLNPHETNVLAGILTRAFTPAKSTAVADRSSTSQDEERKVVAEFLEKHNYLNRLLSDG